MALDSFKKMGHESKRGFWCANRTHFKHFDQPWGAQTQPALRKAVQLFALSDDPDKFGDPPLIV